MNHKSNIPSFYASFVKTPYLYAIGGIIGIVGFGLMFVTLGASTVLIGLGAALGGAGALAAGIAGLVGYGITRYFSISFIYSFIPLFIYLFIYLLFKSFSR